MNVFHDFDVSSQASDLTRTLDQVTAHIIFTVGIL